MVSHQETNQPNTTRTSTAIATTAAPAIAVRNTVPNNVGRSSSLSYSEECSEETGSAARFFLGVPPPDPLEYPLCDDRGMIALWGVTCSGRSARASSEVWMKLRSEISLFPRNCKQSKTCWISSLRHFRLRVLESKTRVLSEGESTKEVSRPKQKKAPQLRAI